MDGLTILVVEDNPGDLVLLKEAFAEAGIGWDHRAGPVEIVHAKRLDEAFNRMAETPVDLLLLDLSLPDSEGVATVVEACKRAPDAPIIVLTGLEDEAVVTAAAQAGAQDYLVKDKIDGRLLMRTIRYAIERKQTELALATQKQLFENLVAVARATAEGPTLAVTLQNALDVAVQLTQAELGSLFLLDEAGQVTHSLLSRGGLMPLQEREVLDRVSRVTKEGLAGWVIRHHQTVLIEDLTQDDRWLHLPDGAYKARAGLAVPILYGSTPLGVLTLTHSAPGHFSPEQAHLMEAAADQMALALHNAQMYEEQRRLAHHQATVYEVLRSVGGHLDPHTVTQAAVEAIAQLTPWTGVTIVLPDDEAAHLVVGATAGDTPLDGDSLLPVQEGITGRAFRSGRTQYAPDVGQDPDYVADHAATRSELAVPLRRGERVLGVLNTESDREFAFDADDVRLAESLAEAIALALDNARLYTAVQSELAERKRAEAQLRLQVAALESAANGIVITDRKGSIIWANPAFARLTGYTVEEAIGQNPRILKSGQHDAAFYREMWETISAGQVWRGEVVNRRKDGTRYTEEMTITPVRNVQGEITHFIAIKQDITERKRAERVLRQAKEAAEAASRAKSTFLANMSHELRTPLNVIIGYSELLQEEVEDLGYSEIVPDLEKIEGAGNHLLAIINDILDLSKIEAGRMELSLETFSVPAMIDRLVSTASPLVEKSGNRLLVDCPADIGTMRADSAKVRQILYNLLSNAAKFTEDGEVRLAVTRVGGSEQEDWLVFHVADTGIGMSPDQIDQLFQAFTQADASATRKYGGSGLGLTISQRFCHMMGGEIAVESALGVGTTFTVRLPAHVVAAPPEADLPPAVPGAPLQQTRTLDGVHSPVTPTVLVIDDDPEACELIGRALRRDGFCAVVAHSGREGLRLAREVAPEAITLDVLMPDMDGWAVLAALKKDPQLADIPVVMVTFVDNRSKGFALGASDYMLKPIDSKRLGTILRRCGRHPGRILIVEDDLLVRRTLRAMLEAAGWQVDEAVHGREGLERLAERRPDMILLDLVMPEMDGFQFLEELRRVAAWRSIPIVVITGKKLTAKDYRRLDGYVESILQKEAYRLEEMLVQIRALMVSRVWQGDQAAGRSAQEGLTGQGEGP